MWPGVIPEEEMPEPCLQMRRHSLGGDVWLRPVLPDRRPWPSRGQGWGLSSKPRVGLELASGWELWAP